VQRPRYLSGSARGLYPASRPAVDCTLYRGLWRRVPIQREHATWVFYWSRSTHHSFHGRGGRNITSPCAALHRARTRIFVDAFERVSRVSKYLGRFYPSILPHTFWRREKFIPMLSLQTMQKSRRTMHVTRLLGGYQIKGCWKLSFSSCVSSQLFMILTIFLGPGLECPFGGNPISGKASQLAQQRLVCP